MTNIYDHGPAVGRVVCDRPRRGVGRIVAVGYAATGWSEAWHLIRLAGMHRDTLADYSRDVALPSGPAGSSHRGSAPEHAA